MSAESVHTTVNWELMHAGGPPGLVTCFCGGTWQSHFKTVKYGDGLVLVAELPCPECGKHARIRRASMNFSQDDLPPVKPVPEVKGFAFEANLDELNGKLERLCDSVESLTKYVQHLEYTIQQAQSVWERSQRH